MTIRVAAIEVSHWHALFDAAYLRHLVAMPDVELVARAGSRCRARRQARGRGRQPADLHRLPQDAGGDPARLRGGARAAPADGRDRPRPARPRRAVPDGEADGDQRRGGGGHRGQGGAAEGVRRRAAGPALPPFAMRARELLAAGRFGPLSHIYVRINRPAPARYPAWDCAVDARPGRGGRRLPAQPGPARPRHVPPPDRRGRAGDRRPDQHGARTGSASRTTPRCCCARRAACWAPSRSATASRAWAPTASGRSPAATPSSP